MKIEGIRAGRTPELGPVDLALGGGLVGWSGGTARTRRLFADLLRWALGGPTLRHPAADGLEPTWTSDRVPHPGDGDPPNPHPAGSWGPEGGPDQVRVDVSIRDHRISLRAGADRTGVSVNGSSALRNRLGLSPEALGFAWTGGGWTEPEPLWRAGARLLATQRGIPRLERALARLGASPGRVGSEGGASAGAVQPNLPEGNDLEGTRQEGGAHSEVDPAVEAELAAVTLRLEELADVPGRLRSLEAELRSLRADAAEVVGDLEVATMDWLRERQDAETHLQQYRDQARELRARMREMEEKGPEGACPFCGRALGDHLEDVMAELEEEWDGLVQDGTWWRRRREQLELKPEELQELERRAVTLQSRVEDCAERLERCRFELREWDELRGRREELAALAGDDRIPVGGPDRRDGRNGADESAAVPQGVEERRRNALLRAFRHARQDVLQEEKTRLTRSAGSL
ncbi:MAG: hypothetical protein R3223_11820, partial [Longimicrobiales bacterium]|nr:hypothetical protein [Longimicrobiales bacterium]